MKFMNELREMQNTYKQLQEKLENVSFQTETCLKPAMKSLDRRLREYEFEIAPHVKKVQEKLERK